MKLKSYTIDSIEGYDYTITFDFGKEQSTQTIHFETYDKEILQNVIMEYAADYITGKEIEEKAKPVVTPELADLIGTPQTC